MREYFYTIDPGGNLYHDGTRLVDSGFLEFFFRRVRANHTGRHQEYPWISPCGREMNYIRAPDTPIVFDRIVPTDEGDFLGYNGSGLMVPFEPDALRLATDGALYHPALPDAGIALGRLHAYLVMEISDWIQEQNGKYILTYRQHPNPILPYNANDP